MRGGRGEEGGRRERGEEGGERRRGERRRRGKEGREGGEWKGKGGGVEPPVMRRRHNSWAAQTPRVPPCLLQRPILLAGSIFVGSVIDQAPAADGTSILVNVDVDAAAAPTIAMLAAQDRVALVRDAGR